MMSHDLTLHRPLAGFLVVCLLLSAASAGTGATVAPGDGTDGRLHGAATASPAMGPLDDDLNDTEETIEGTTENTTDTVENTTEETTENTTDSVNETTDTVNETTDTVENTTEETTENTTETVENTTEETTETVDGTVDDTTDTVEETTEETTDTVDDTTDDTGDTVEDSTTDSTETIDETAEGSTSAPDAVESPDNSTETGAEGETELNVSVEYERDDRGSDSVNVIVTGAKAGSHLEIDVLTAETRDDPVAFEGIEFTPERSGSLTLNLSVTGDRLDGSPRFTPGDGADSLAHVRLDHSISNANVSDVAFTFRVSKGRLRTTGTSPEELALYRYSDGTWTALPTKFVGETDGHYVFHTSSPGMSEFVVGALRPEFELSAVSANRTATSVGETVRVGGFVTNIGKADGVFTATVRLDGSVVATRDLTVAAGGTRQLNVDHTFLQSGTYEIRVNDEHVGSLTVEDSEGPRTNRTGWQSGKLGLEFGLGATLFFSVFGLVGRVRRRN